MRCVIVGPATRKEKKAQETAFYISPVYLWLQTREP